jgi:hypothetical protein
MSLAQMTISAVCSRLLWPTEHAEHAERLLRGDRELPGMNADPDQGADGHGACWESRHRRGSP